MITALHCGRDDLVQSESYIAAALKEPRKTNGKNASHGFRARVTKRIQRRESDGGDEGGEQDEDSSDENCVEIQHATPSKSVASKLRAFLAEQREVATATLLSFIIKLSRSSKVRFVT